MNISKSNLLIDCLPDDLYYSFRNYLSQDDYQQLLNTSKNIFILIRRNSIIYHLTEKYSIKYCEDENFRNQLLEKVENPSKQLRIKFTFSMIQFHEDLFDLIPVYLICISFQFQSAPYTCMGNIKEFTLLEYSKNTPFINFSQCERIAFRKCSGVTNISLLENCKDVTLDNCENISDFSSLGKQRSLSITKNPHLTNVMNFRSIRTLILEDCGNLVDISPLRGVYDLSLIRCEAVSDLSSLGGHHRLEISDCNLILSGYHVLKDIPIVKLVVCNISDVSVLSNAKDVLLELCDDLVDVNPLRGVKELTLRSCEKIEDISMLTTVQKLTLGNLPQLKKYEGINQMRNLSLQVIDLKDVMFERFPNAKMIERAFFPFDKIIPFLPSFYFTNRNRILY